MGWGGEARGPSERVGWLVGSVACEELSVRTESGCCWRYGPTCLGIVSYKVFPSVRSDTMFLFSLKCCELGEKLLEPSAFLKRLNFTVKNDPFARLFPLHAASCGGFRRSSMTGWWQTDMFSALPFLGSCMINCAASSVELSFLCCSSSCTHW